jgi:WD40 repeat protein
MVLGEFFMSAKRLAKALISFAVFFIMALHILTFTPEAGNAAPAPDIHPSQLSSPQKKTVLDGLGFTVALNSDGSRVMAITNSALGKGSIVDINNSDVPPKTLALKGMPIFLRWSNDDKYIACCYSGPALQEKPTQNVLFLLDGKKGNQIRELLGHRAGVNHLAFSPDSKMLASASDDATVILWNVSDGRPIRTLKGHGGRVRSVTFNHDGKLLVSSEAWGIRLWEVSSGRMLMKLDRKHIVIRRVDFHPKKNLIAIGVDRQMNDEPRDFAVELWEIRNGKDFKLVGYLHGPSHIIRSVAFHPGGRHVAACADDGKVYIWDLQSRKFIHTLKHRKGSDGEENETLALEMAFSTNGKFLAVGTDGPPNLTIWDLYGRKR